MIKKFISRSEASNITSYSIRQIDRMIRDGRIKAFKAAGSSRVLIYMDSLSEENFKAIVPKFKNKLDEN